MAISIEECLTILETNMASSPDCIQARKQMFQEVEQRLDSLRQKALAVMSADITQLGWLAHSLLTAQ
ncbi:hypothetical protein MMC22_005692 [Lobaria immixta]|nr:hypothetical protein [Lobaria immixta]